MKHSISFVVPAFNADLTVVEAINSIYYGNFTAGDEIVVVNDTSTDKTLAVLRQLKKAVPLRVITNKQNRGCPASRNIGIRAARNQLIFNLDADDVLVPGSVPALKKVLISTQVDAVAFGEIFYFRKNTQRVEQKWFCKPGIMTLADFLAGRFVPGGNFLYTKAAWKSVGGYWEWGKGIHEFWGYALKLIASGKKFAVVPELHYYHRLSDYSLFARESKSKAVAADMATRMLLTFKSLLDPRDVQYVQSLAGRYWFNQLDTRPIRIKSGKVGQTGYMVIPLYARISQYIYTLRKLLHLI